MADKMTALVTRFVADIRAAVRAELIAEIVNASKGSGSYYADDDEVAGKPKREAKAKPTKGGRAARMSPEDLASLTTKVANYISDNSDKGVARGQVMERFQLTETQTGNVIGKLKAAGTVKIVGTKRAARYFPTGANGLSEANGSTAKPAAKAKRSGGKKGKRVKK